MSVTFADVVPIEPVGSHQYSTFLPDEYCIGTVPNGGYITSAFLIAARTHMQTTHPTRSAPHPINLHLEFLRRTSSGPALFKVKDVKLGSRISNLHLVLSQKQDENDESSWEDEVEGYIIVSNVKTEEGLSLDTAYELHPPRMPVDLPSLAKNKEDTNWTMRDKDPFPKFRRAAQNIQLFLVKPSRRPANRPKSIVDQWVRFAPRQYPDKQARWTNDALGFLVDIFPQIVEGYVNPVIEEATVSAHSEADLRQIIKQSEPRAKFWYPTLAMNLDIKKLLPEPSDENGGDGVEWLFVRVRAKRIHNGRFDLQVEVWDTNDELVATSSHASLVMDAARNTTRNNRKGGKKESKI